MNNDRNYCKVLFLLCFIILVSVFAYTFNNQYLENNIKLYNEGYINGTQDTLMYILSVGLKCETIPLRFNETVGVNLIAAECLPPEVIEYLQRRQE